MRVQITARRCDVPRRVQTRAETQVTKLLKFEPRLAAAEVVFEEEKHLRRVEGILSVDGGETVVAKGEGEDFRSALDQMLDRVSRMLRRRRTQRIDPRRAEPQRAAAD